MPAYVECSLNTDTVRYLTNGFADVNNRIKGYYETLGYTCREMPAMIGASTYIEHVSDRKDIKFLEDQGYTCEAEN